MYSFNLAFNSVGVPIQNILFQTESIDVRLEISSTLLRSVLNVLERQGLEVLQVTGLLCESALEWEVAGTLISIDQEFGMGS